MILIDPDLESDPSRRTSPAAKLPSARLLSRFLAEAQAAVRLRGEVAVLLTTDAALRSLNRRFRGKNRPTDVLSFSPANLLQSSKPAERDIAISVETALRQALEQGHPLSTELKVLILHGLLHLAGYDHESDAGRMHRRERRLRARLNLPLGLIERTGKQVGPTTRPTAGGRRTASASRRDAGKIDPDGVRRGARRTQSGERRPNASKPRRGEGNPPPTSSRSARP